MNMLFKKMGKRPQEEEIAPPAPMDSNAAHCTDPAGEKDTATDESKDPTHTDIVYPSGLKLALLMTSIFVGMFLVALVCSDLKTLPGACPCTCKLTSLVCRINLSSQRPYPRSPTSFTRQTILAGTAQPTCSPIAHSCWYLEKYIPS
jgi:hypothetical protein